MKKQNKKKPPNVCSERPHSCIKGRGSVRWCNGNVQIVSNLEALRLQCQGIICTFPARHSTANVFQSAKSDQTHNKIYHPQLVISYYLSSFIDV